MRFDEIPDQFFLSSNILSDYIWFILKHIKQLALVVYER